MEDLELKKFMLLQIEVFQILLQEFTVTVQQIVGTAAELFRDEWEWGNTDITQFLELGREILMQKKFLQKTWGEYIKAFGTLKYPDVKSTVHIYTTGATEPDNGSGRVATVGCKIVSGLTQYGFTKTAGWVIDCYGVEGYKVGPTFHFTEQDFNTPAIEILTAY